MKIQNDLKTLSSDIKKQQQVGQRCKLFLSMKNTKKNIEKMKLDASKVNEEIDLYFYKVKVKQEKQELDWNKLDRKFFTFQELLSSRRKRTASYSSYIKTEKVNSSSLCLLSEETLLLTFYNGNSVFIIQNIKTNNKTYETVTFPFAPWGITKVDNNKVAVTFPHQGIVRLIPFSETMTVTNTEDIKVGAGCYDIACSNNNLIVSYVNPGKVKILDMSGHVLNTFDKSSYGRSLFTYPHYLAVSPDNTTIYVSDRDRNTVTSLTFGGKVNAIYKDDQMRRPYQLTVDGSGPVYLCGWLSNDVHQLSSDLTKVKILLDSSHGMDMPWGISYCQNNNRLYVGQSNSKTIKVFDISLE